MKLPRALRASWGKGTRRLGQDNWKEYVMWRGVIVWIIVWAVVACEAPQGDTSSEVREASPQIDPLPGTAQAAAELAAIYQAALEDPMRYGHLNRERAELLHAEVARTTGSDQSMARYRYASELLSAGETETAIVELGRVIEDLGPRGRVVSETTTPVFELLAIAYLRLGEEQNRMNDPAGASILPLSASAMYTRERGSRHAISLYRQILDRYPDDLQSRWLLNIAHMTLGEYPQDVPADVLIAGLEPSPNSEVPRFRNIAPTLALDVDGIAGGLSVEDFNGDGFLDVLATARGLNDPMHLFFADGLGGFIDHTGASGLNGLVGGLNTFHADYNNDGFVDVFIVRGGWLGADGNHPNTLLRNNGDGTFEDVAARAGFVSRHPTQTAAWGDFNNDGWLDIFIGNEGGENGGGSGRCELYVNNRDETFTEIAVRAGIDVFEFVKAAAWGDVNNDGLIDLYLSVLDQPNRLYLNRGGNTLETWRFEEVGAAAGVQDPVFSFPVFFWDYNDDGWEDLFVASFDVPRSFESAGETAAQYLGLHVESQRNRVYRNNGDGTFTDVAPDLGLDLSLWAMGINFGDLNNDGFPDLYVGTGTPDLRSVMPNRMFLNENGTRFRDFTFDGGFGHLQKGHAIAFADFDRDGDQDVYAVMGGAVEGDHYPNALFENPGFGDGNAWVVLQLEGRTANRSAIGARISLTVTDRNGEQRIVHQTVSTGGSFGASSLQQEIGLGQTARIDELSVSWPNQARSVDTYNYLAIDRYYEVVEGRPPLPLDVPPVPLNKAARPAAGS
jgi:hypothetical protein